MSTPLVIVGAGGHAKVVLATVLASGRTVTSIVDDDARRWGSSLMGVRIEGPTQTALDNRDVECVLAVGNNAHRQSLASRAVCSFASVVHPSATVHSSVCLGPGCVVFAGAVIQPDTMVGAHAIVNTAASIDHDCRIGDFVHIAPGVRLAGGVTVGELALIGIGAVAIPGVSIGARTTVGAGAAVVGDIASDVVAVGVPARYTAR